MEEKKNTIKAIKDLRRAQRDIEDLPPTLLMDDVKHRERLVAHMLSDIPYPITKDEKETMAKIMVDALEWGWRSSLSDKQYKEWKENNLKRKEEERLARMMEDKRNSEPKRQTITIKRWNW